jgi:hypothetical protein
MLGIFFVCEGIVHQEFIPPGQVVNQHFYREVLQHLEGTSLPKTFGTMEVGLVHSP